eukprot:TRINITY_DN3027_c0_g1_i1.p1 TRINITY_DN3027_c0_g1~~TRINITY_DN3027_c0_g1_i1.p1  ORF type:complete len:341 (-),score=87.56 TRINITY_DN3027_c0_g1_i1:21-1043(-)
MEVAKVGEVRRRDGAVITEGDIVIFYSSKDNFSWEKMKKGGIFNNKFGAFHHNDIIDKAKYGSRVTSKQNRGWIHLLQMTPELWTNGAMAHRTQIIYTTDISFISFRLGLRPGAVVVESGTGSGSFSHAICRSIKPNGHLHTFEFHQLRAETAKKEFEILKINDVVTVNCRDVCALGFDLEEESVDAVFLDLPSPWGLVLESAKKILKKNGKFCSFSPCIEQVQKSSQHLRELNFIDIETVEVLFRPFDVHQIRTYNVSFGTQPKENSGIEEERRNKRKKTETEGEGEGEPEEEEEEKDQEDEGQKEEKEQKKKNSKVATKPRNEIKGHTSFLTFATKSV